MRRSASNRIQLALAVAILSTGVATFASPAGAVPLVRPTASVNADDIAAGRPAAASQPAVRLGVPTSVATGLPPVPVNRSTCRDDLPGAAMKVVIPDISYACSVYSGRQETIDAGAVASITDSGDGGLLAKHPGEPGTLWLAAHRTTHGGAFAEVPDLALGAIVTVSDWSGTASYRVVARKLVNIRNDLVIDAMGQPSESATLEAIARADRGGNGAPRLLLQTCEGTTKMWMIYADLVVA